MQSKKIKRLKKLVAEIQGMFPASVGTVTLHCRNYTKSELALQRFTDHAAATEVFRDLGIGEREKMVFDGDGIRPPWSVLSGVVGGLEVTAYVDALPPSCHIETVTEKIPKTQTVDTGDMIEIKRTKIVCGKD